jgi:Ca2+-transporting ATPase
MAQTSTVVRRPSAAADAHAQSTADVCAILQTDATRGLSSDEAERRLSLYGPNVLPEAAGRTLLRALADQFTNFLILLLLAATVLAAAIGEYVDAITIAAIVLLSAMLGLAQEWRAERTLQALRAMMAPSARVFRDDRIRDIPGAELVPGDVVLLEVGQYVPADLRLLEGVRLNINESSLTGESVEVGKDSEPVVGEDTPVSDRVNCAFASTMVTYGRGRGVVCATGSMTEVGRIATMIGAYEEEQTPLQRRMSGLGRWLGAAAIMVSVAVFAVGSATGKDLLDMLLTAVSLAVAAVPEGLPAVVVISLALGMQRMARRNALMRRLSAAETLGSATVIATDKTGTLTKGEMTVEVIHLGPNFENVDVTGVGYEPSGEFLRNGSAIDPSGDPQLRLLLVAAVLCNDARLQKEGGRWKILGDTTEGSLVVAAEKAGLSWERLEASQPRQRELPFSSERARMTTVNQHEDRQFAYTKGAPDVVLPLCTSRQAGAGESPMSESDRELILQSNDELASRGLRVLAIAHRAIDATTPVEDAERDITFLGLVAMRDPPREEARDAVARCRTAGIVPIMITGDHAGTALAIARELSIAEGPDGGVTTGADLSAMSDEQLREAVGRTRVFARISPEQKMRIVEALKREGHIVAVTGDGVNDAPALKRSDIGVAMGITGTDVARAAADMVITDDNFASIVAAAEEGRKIFDNIRNFVVFLLSANIGEILLIFIGVVVGLPLPLLAAQILLVNLVTDSLPALALTMEEGDPDAMLRPPRPPDEPVLTRPVAAVSIIRGVVEGVGALVLFTIWLEVLDEPEETARTVALATIVLAELMEAHGSRSLYRTIVSMGVFSNVYLWGATALSFAVTLAVIYVSPLRDAFEVSAIGAVEWAAVTGVALLRLAVIEGLKVSPWRLRPASQTRTAADTPTV